MPGQTSVFRLQASFVFKNLLKSWGEYPRETRWTHRNESAGLQTGKCWHLNSAGNKIECVMFRARSVNRTDQSFSSTFPVQDFWWFREKKLRNSRSKRTCFSAQWSYNRRNNCLFSNEFMKWTSFLWLALPPALLAAGGCGMYYFV